jgi:hypothetical protein
MINLKEDFDLEHLKKIDFGNVSECHFLHG